MILYEGPSLLDPEVPIVVIAIEDENPKTGRMLFTWILRQDRAPEVAAYDGSDDAICGDCKFRAQIGTARKLAATRKMMDKTKEPESFAEELSFESLARREEELYDDAKRERTCYVRLSPAEGADEALPPSEVWRAWKGGGFREVEACENYVPDETGEFWRYFGPLPVRIGSYGDPAAVPTRVWAELVRYQKHWTGYTHLWQSKDRHDDGIIRADPDLKKYCMASVDTPEEREAAHELGWRTFMVVPEERAPHIPEVQEALYGARRDILCPATDPHPKRNATCSTCLLCRGTSAPAPSIWEIAHGTNKENHTW